MKKNIVALLLIVCFLMTSLVFTACGDNEDIADNADIYIMTTIECVTDAFYKPFDYHYVEFLDDENAELLMFGSIHKVKYSKADEQIVFEHEIPNSVFDEVTLSDRKLLISVTIGIIKYDMTYEHFTKNKYLKQGTYASDGYEPNTWELFVIENKNELIYSCANSHSNRAKYKIKGNILIAEYSDPLIPKLKQLIVRKVTDIGLYLQCINAVFQKVELNINKVKDSSIKCGTYNSNKNNSELVLKKNNCEFYYNDGSTHQFDYKVCGNFLVLSRDSELLPILVYKIDGKRLYESLGENSTYYEI